MFRMLAESVFQRHSDAVAILFQLQHVSAVCLGVKRCAKSAPLVVEAGLFRVLTQGGIAVGQRSRFGNSAVNGYIVINGLQNALLFQKRFGIDRSFFEKLLALRGLFLSRRRRADELFFRFLL